ncbi:unnamed protein product [Vicia faba]|uniref:Peptidase C1A papain C-terminal domain-containing protein n=2 Tax=Vicia faba TaxID=3906 RepID=A0AAV1AP84_VICFA|nr:unnamed protein product [Vicia faba]
MNKPNARGSDREKLASSKGKFAQYLTGILEVYFSYHCDAYNTNGVYLHDPTALLAAVDPSLVTCTEGAVRVQTSGITRGLTILYNKQKRADYNPDQYLWEKEFSLAGRTYQRQDLEGSCGSCWAFSTTGALEGAHYLATGKLVSLSEQQLVDCDHVCDPEQAGSCDSGCNGGLMNNAFEYLLQSGGVVQEKDYAYTGRDGSCKFDKSKVVASVSNFSVVSLDEEQIAANLVKNGPLAVGINAAWMQTYMSGVSCPYVCAKSRLDHGVLLVGFGKGAYAPIRLKEKPVGS